MSTPAMPTLFINLPTSDLNKAKSFYTALGFTHHVQFSDSETLAYTLPPPNQNVSLMLHLPSRYKCFTPTNKSLADTNTHIQVINSFTCNSKEEVDTWLDKAVKAGGKGDPFVIGQGGDFGGCYCRSWEDQDGNVWEGVVMFPGKGCQGKGGEEDNVKVGESEKSD